MVDLDKLRVGAELIGSVQGRRVRVLVSRVKHTLVLIHERAPGDDGITTRRVHRVTFDLVPRKG
jgi:hypothetical protein